MVTEHITRKPDGTWWSVKYTGRSIDWTEIQRRDKDSVLHNLDGPGPTSPQGALLGKALPRFPIALAVLNAGTEIWQVWEQRQQRKFFETMQEQNQALEWLDDMMSRWAGVHRSGGKLDLHVSEYLVHQINDTLRALAVNKKIVLPQSVLYDLSLIQESFRSMRLMLGEQIEMLVKYSDIPIEEYVEQLMPGRKLDASFLFRLMEEPTMKPIEKNKQRTAEPREAELSAVLTDPGKLQQKLFPSNRTVLELEENNIPEERQEQNSRGFLENITAVFRGFAVSSPVEDSVKELGDRREQFREMILLGEEFYRVHALSHAWKALELIISEASGLKLGVVVANQDSSVQLVSMTNTQSMFIPLALNDRKVSEINR